MPRWWRAPTARRLTPRGGEPPQILDGPCRAVAGLDPVAGGTWFGVNERGVLVAVTNRPRSQAPPNPRSRGLLARELLACPSAAAAVDLATKELDQGRYAGCNFVCADQERVVVLQAGDWLRVRFLPPGIHVLTAHDVNDASDPRLGYAALVAERARLRHRQPLRGRPARIVRPAGQRSPAHVSARRARRHRVEQHRGPAP